jgi:ADP-heptose:LPS heptosyltransferase
MEQNSLCVGNDRGLKNVLVARFSALGDVAMTIPVLYSACRCYPDVNFIMVTRPSMTNIFVNHPSNLIIEGVDVKNQYKGIKGLYQLVKELVVKYNIDAFVDLHDVLRTRIMGLFFHLRRIPVSVLNKGRRHKRALTRRNNKIMLPLLSSRARYRGAFHKMGMPIQDCFDGLYGKNGHGDEQLFSAITAPKTSGEHWIAIAPFAAHQGKIYPTDKMEEVVKQLLDDETVKIFLFGGGGIEKEILDSWVSKYNRVISLAGKKYGFPTELALMSFMDVVVSMDSANMHLASIVGTKVVSVWGATHYYCGFKGWRQNDNDAVQLAMTCRPCSVFGNKPCHRGDYLCLTGITPSMIIDKVRANLNKNC